MTETHTLAHRHTSTCVRANGRQSACVVDVHVHNQVSAEGEDGGGRVLLAQACMCSIR